MSQITTFDCVEVQEWGEGPGPNGVEDSDCLQEEPLEGSDTAES